MGLLFAILGLSFLIFFHELGHFLCARFFGVRVLVFSIGFGKKLFIWRYKGTEYALSLIPLGGYVKLKGEITKDSNQQTTDKDLQSLSAQSTSAIYISDSLLDKHPLQRIAILFAGPFFNFIFAFLVYAFLFVKGVPTYSEKPIVGDIGHEFGAFKLLQKNDEILSVNGLQITKFSDISKALNTHKQTDTQLQDNTATLLIARAIPYTNTTLQNNSFVDSTQISHNEKQHIQLIVPLSQQDNRMVLGITPLVTIEYFSFFEILQKATIMVYDNIMLIYRGIRDILFGLIGIENLSGVIGITDVSAKAYNAGFINFILVIALISVNLGVLNLLPLPMLDGGQILFTLYEWLTGQILHERIANALVVFGFSFIIGLMLIGFYNDIMRIIAV